MYEKKVVELCKQYHIDISPDTDPTHYEFVLKYPETSYTEKKDIGFLPPYLEIKYSDVVLYM